jgi:phage tail protein X
MSDATAGNPVAALNKKVGGVPLKWIILIGVVIGLGYWYWNRSRGGTPGVGLLANAVGAQGTSTADTSTTVGGTGGGGGGGGGTTATMTNGQWALNASNALAGQGKYSPAEISNALSAYLNGRTLTTTELEIVNAALLAYGAPPEGVIPTNTNTGPGYVDTAYERQVNSLYQTLLGRDADEAGLNYWTARLTSGEAYGTIAQAIAGSPEAANLIGTNTRRYTVVRGDTLTSIANRFYNNADYQRIYDANAGMITDPDNLTPGTVLTIPV